MRYAIPLLCDRVSPRCTIADSVLLVSARHGRISACEPVGIETTAWMEILKLVQTGQIDVLVCGGIKSENRETVLSHDVSIIENVACTAQEAVEAIRNGILRPGYGLVNQGEGSPAAGCATERAEPAGRRAKRAERDFAPDLEIDCLRCEDRRCLRGEPCPKLTGVIPEPTDGVRTLLDVSMDIAFEEERNLCRLAELVYFCLEMNYRRLGIAYCVDLQQPAEILTGLLRRFFQVIPVCCKVGGARLGDGIMNRGRRGEESSPEWIACNPLGQAAVLNAMKTDLNIVVGLCMGSDCVFAGASDAPVTTIFVKDKSLANNPIGAVYSEHYLREITGSYSGK